MKKYGNAPKDYLYIAYAQAKKKGLIHPVSPTVDDIAQNAMEAWLKKPEHPITSIFYSVLNTGSREFMYATRRDRMEITIDDMVGQSTIQVGGKLPQYIDNIILNDFFNSINEPSIKNLFTKIYRDGEEITDVAKELKCSRQTIYNRVNAYIKEYQERLENEKSIRYEG